MHAYRIADARHPIIDPTGAILHGGRWNSIGKRVIYAAETYSTALLEVLVHANLNRLPRNQQVVQIFIPEETEIETADPAAVPGWDAADNIASRAFGDRWYDQRRSLILRVPNVVTQGRDWNLGINAEHPQFSALRADSPVAVYWDPRLVNSSSGE